MYVHVCVVKPVPTLVCLWYEFNAVETFHLMWEFSSFAAAKLLCANVVNGVGVKKNKKH